MRKVQSILIITFVTALLASSAHATPVEWHGGIHNITSGTYFEVGLFDNAQATISGSATFGRLEIYDTSEGTLADDASISQIWVRDRAKFYMTGGTLHSLSLKHESVATLSGCKALTVISADSNSKVRVLVNDINDVILSPSGGELGTGTLQGHLLDGSYIDIDLSGPDTYSNIQIIPEPTCALLMIAGLPYVRKITRSLR